MPSPAAEMAVAATRPNIDRENDPRNPRKRLAAFFDDGMLELITAEDTSGILCAVGKVRGTTVVAYCSDATIQGGAMGFAGCKAILVAYERALTDNVPIAWASGTPAVHVWPRVSFHSTRSARSSRS